MAVYLQVEGITGDVSQEHHSGWTDVMSVKLPTERANVNTAPGNVSDRTTSQVDFTDVEITKYMDLASPKLMTWNITGKTKKVVIHVCKEDGKVLLELVLYDTILTNYDSEADEEGKVEETIKLDYTKIEYNYTPYDKTNTAGNPVRVTYDLETAKGSGSE